MSKLLDFLTFRDRKPNRVTGTGGEDEVLRTAERDAAILTDKYPLDGADIESVSEYRLASLLQYPHY